MNDRLVGLLGPGSRYQGDLVFEGRVRIDGEFTGNIQSDSFLEIGPAGRVHGSVEVAQILIGGTFEGTLEARERCTFLESAIVRGKVVTPWLDVRAGCRMNAEVIVKRAKS